MIQLYYAGYKRDATGYGWATANSNLVRELSARTIFCSADPMSANVMFTPALDHNLTPVKQPFPWCKVNLLYTFFEFPLGPKARENAGKFDVVFAGSSWCLERLREAGITNGKLLIQGVDQSIFSPKPPRKHNGLFPGFRIFSGGKFEYRKGQDLVIAAFKEFSKRHDDAHLVCSWFNPWPQLIEPMLSEYSNYIRGNFDILGKPEHQVQLFRCVLNENDIMGHRFTVLPQFPQDALALEMRHTDAGLFPNRCEGGTNLVLMEYASMGRKVIANAKTGHADIAGAISYEIPATNDENHWAVQSVDDIIDALERAYEAREEPEHESLKAVRDQWTWGRAAETIIAEAQRFL